LLTLGQAANADEFRKIASAGGDITEILFELGVGDKVVAVDTTSIYPAATKDLPKIGYVRELSAEGVLSTGADVLIGSHDMGAPAVMDNLKAAGMRVEYAPKGDGATQYAEKVTHIAAALGLEARGQQLIADYDGAVAKVAERRKTLNRAPRVLILLSVRDGSPIAAGKDTTGHDMIELTGGQNMATFDGWKPMNSEAIIAAAPDIIVMSSLHLKRLGGYEVIMNRPDIAETPAGKNQSYAILSPQMMLQFGPRAPIAMNDLVSAYEKLALN